MTLPHVSGDIARSERYRTDSVASRQFNCLHRTVSYK